MTDTPAADCLFLSGPTASGKTEIGLHLAERLGAEIVSLDSMAIYRGMDIGTAKPSYEQQRRGPHHLIDIVEPTDDFSLSAYVDLAEKTVVDIRRRGREVLFVGGTPLYLKSLLRGIFEGPPADWEFRRAVEEEVEQIGVEALHQRLQQADPLAADWLHPHDKRRIIRALEVLRATGQPLSHQQTQFEEGAPAEERRVFVLDWPRPVLHQRINARVDEMFVAGLVDEVRGLLERHGHFSRTAMQAVGYREVMEHLRGEIDLEETIRRTKVRTRRFAKRQMTWFRHLSECRFLPRSEEQGVEEVTEEILRAVCNGDS